MENFPRNFCSPFLKAFNAFLKMLLYLGLKPAFLNTHETFLDAIEDDDSKAVKMLLDLCLDPDASVNIKGKMKPAICLCAEMERTTLLEVLLQAGANIDQTDSHGRTSLHNASASKNEKMVTFLLSKGAEVNRETRDMGHTPLHLAVGGLNFEIVRLLINAGADVERRNGAMMTPLVYACTRLSSTAQLCACCGKMALLSVLFELLKAKSCVKSCDENGWTALHHIVRGNCKGANVEALELLLSYPCNVDAKNRHGQTPLELAVMHDDRKAVLLLLKAGCRVDIETRPENLTPVEMAIIPLKFYDVTELLLAAGARIKREVWMDVREDLEYKDPLTLKRLLAVGAECPKLYNLCRRAFYDHYGTETTTLIDKLTMSPLIKTYLTFDVL